MAKIESPLAEYRFHPTRKWRFDFAWPSRLLALEVQGGLWVYGRHNRAASYLRDAEKFNAAAVLGWRILLLTPQQLREIAPLVNLLSAELARAESAAPTR
ncbi:MAG: hypothetical protein ACK4JD_12600 [Thermoflexales bacterium]